MMAGQVVDHLIRSERMTGKDDVLIAFFPGKGKVCVDILIRIGESFIPGPYDLPLSGVQIDRLDPPYSSVR